MSVHSSNHTVSSDSRNWRREFRRDHLPQPPFVSQWLQLQGDAVLIDIATAWHYPVPYSRDTSLTRPQQRTLRRFILDNRRNRQPRRRGRSRDDARSLTGSEHRGPQSQGSVYTQIRSVHSSHIRSTSAHSAPSHAHSAPIHTHPSRDRDLRHQLSLSSGSGAGLAIPQRSGSQLRRDREAQLQQHRRDFETLAIPRSGSRHHSFYFWLTKNRPK